MSPKFIYMVKLIQIVVRVCVITVITESKYTIKLTELILSRFYKTIRSSRDWFALVFLLGIRTIVVNDVCYACLCQNNTAD